MFKFSIFKKIIILLIPEFSLNNMSNMTILKAQIKNFQRFFVKLKNIYKDNNNNDDDDDNF